MLSPRNQDVLCALLNSYVANYLIRQVMTTHLGSSTVEAVRVPRPVPGSPMFESVADLSQHMTLHADAIAHARLQALAAHCYRLTSDEFAHVLTTFPLLDTSERSSALAEFRRSTVA